MESYQSNTKPRVVLLYRASSKKQTDSDNDIPLQRNILKPWAEQKGWQFIREFVEGGISGYKVHTADRDALNEIKAMAVRKEFDILGIYMSDRLGRIADETPLVVSFLNGHGIKVISYCEGEINSANHSDKLMTYIRYWQAEGESIKTSARVCDAVLENVSKGRWRGGPAPYGYRSVSRGTLNYKGKPILDVEIDPETSEHIKTIFRLYSSEHYGTRLVAKYLNDRDIKPPQGTLWNSSLISKLLRCKTYIGIYELHKLIKNKPLIESPVMPNLIIVDEATFYKTQELLKKNALGNRRLPSRHGGQLLTGLVYCGECGSKLTSFYSYSSTDRKKNKPTDECEKKYYYRCVTDQKPKSDLIKCKPSMWSVGTMDNTVIHYAKKFVLDIDKERLLSDHRNESKARMEEVILKIEKADADIEKKEREIKKLKDEIMKTLLGESTFSQDLLSGMLKAREIEYIELAKKLEDAQNIIMQIDQELVTQKTVCEEFDDWSVRFDNSSTADKKAMLLNIIDRIDICPNNISIQFKVQLTPLSNLTPIDNNTQPTPNSQLIDINTSIEPISQANLANTSTVKRYPSPPTEMNKKKVLKGNASIMTPTSMLTENGSFVGYTQTKESREQRQ